jgi:hypothetical protein
VVGEGKGAGEEGEWDVWGRVGNWEERCRVEKSDLRERVEAAAVITVVGEDELLAMKESRFGFDLDAFIKRVTL